MYSISIANIGYSKTAPWKWEHIEVDLSITKKITKQVDSSDFIRSLII